MNLMTLTLIVAAVIFISLAIIFLIFKPIPIKANPRKALVKRDVKAYEGAKPEGEVAAAIAMALEAENSDEVPIAISTALALYLGDGVHDSESFVITIKRPSTAWNSPTLKFRKNPSK
ncbi:MAG: hypothetical protein ACOXZI_07460 [Candidatus Cryptobacteroides sp.]|jgi:hypothetical protein